MWLCKHMGSNRCMCLSATSTVFALIHIVIARRNRAVVPGHAWVPLTLLE
jgi:hypothetical protein